MTFLRALPLGLLLAGAAIAEAPKAFPMLKGPYLGQKLPGAQAELFAPGLVSTGMTERGVAVSTDGKEFYFEVNFGRIATILVSRLVGDRWTEPVVAPFAADLGFFHFEPCLSADGRRMLFLSNRPRAGQAPKPGWGHQHIWASDRKADGTWSDPYDLGAPVNSEESDFYPSLTRDGTLYFSRSRPGGEKSTVWRARWKDGAFQTPEPLPEAVNGASPYNACIAPDESVLIACAAQPAAPGARAVPAYVAFFRTPDDRWSQAVNLGPAVNVPGAAAQAPYLTPDGKVFFFGSNRPRPFDPGGKPVTAQRLLDHFSGPQNGGSDVYWIEAGFLEKLRPAPGK